jgi:hypothetical protein
VTHSGGLVAVQGNGDVAVVGLEQNSGGRALGDGSAGCGAECVVVAAVFLSAVVCEGVVAVDDDDESILSCLKIFLSLSIVLGLDGSPGLYDVGGVLAVWSIVIGKELDVVRASAAKSPYVIVAVNSIRLHDDATNRFS